MNQLSPASGHLLAAVTWLGWLLQLQAPALSDAELHGVLADHSCAVLPLHAAAAPAHKPSSATQTPTDGADVVGGDNQASSQCMLND